MTANNKQERTLHATLCEIERGLFYATFPSRTLEADVLDLPTYGLGACASEVKMRLAKSIRAFGYDTIIWEDALVLPQSHLVARALASVNPKGRPLSE